jgi:hypothetical protein
MSLRTYSADPAFRLGLLSYVASQVVLLLWWAAFFPGLFSYDSVMYVWQATTGHWSTSHSVLYNGFLWLSLVITGQAWLLTLAQTALMAGGIAYAVTGLRRLGVSAGWLFTAAVAAVCLPALGTFTVYVSKDVGFVLCAVFLLGTVARLVAGSRPLWTLWTLFAELALVSLFRPNGYLVIALTVLGLSLVLRGLWLRLTACGVGAVAVGALATTVLYPALGVQPAGSELVLGPAYADLAVALHDRPAAFTPADLALLSTVAPLSYWRDTANCYDADATVNYGRPSFSIDAARAHAGQLFDLWRRVAERTPDVVAGARLCRGAIAWDPFPAGRTVKIPIAGTRTYFDFPVHQIAQSPYAGAIRSAPLSGFLHRVAVFARRASNAPPIAWLAWRGAAWAYLAYASVGLFAWRRRSWAPLALVAVVAATQITVMLDNPSQLVRYMAGPLLLGILLLPLAFARPAAPDAQ